LTLDYHIPAFTHQRIVDSLVTPIAATT